MISLIMANSYIQLLRHMIPIELSPGGLNEVARNQDLLVRTVPRHKKSAAENQLFDFYSLYTSSNALIALY